MADLKPVPGFAYPDWTCNAMSGINNLSITKINCHMRAHKK